jgi:hypothetical protein
MPWNRSPACVESQPGMAWNPHTLLRVRLDCLCAASRHDALKATSLECFLNSTKLLPLLNF